MSQTLTGVRTPFTDEDLVVLIPTSIVQTVTDFGDSEVIFIGTVSGLAVLIAMGNRRAALRFGVTVAVAAAAIAVFKVLFISCVSEFTDAIHLYSPSGHTALSTAFWCSIAAFAAIGRSRRTRIIVAASAGILITAIASSRILLHYHSKAEVLVGFLVGLAAFGTAACLTPRPKQSRIVNRKTNVAFVAVILVAMLVFHGRHFPAERIIHMVAARLDDFVSFCRA